MWHILKNHDRCNFLLTARSYTWTQSVRMALCKKKIGFKRLELKGLFCIHFSKIIWFLKWFIYRISASLWRNVWIYNGSFMKDASSRTNDFHMGFRPWVKVLFPWGYDACTWFLSSCWLDIARRQTWCDDERKICFLFGCQAPFSFRKSYMQISKIHLILRKKCVYFDCTGVHVPV